MIKLFLSGMKLVVFSIVILLIGQIPVGEKRICDHVFTFTRSSLVQVPIHWIAQRFDFSDSRTNGAPGTNQVDKRGTRERDNLTDSKRKPTDRDHREGLSGLLKHTGE